MAQSTIAIIILVVAMILYGIPKMPLSVTTILAMLFMAMFGIIDYNTAYSGFGNSVIFLIAGLMVVGQATVTTGLAQKFGNVLTKTKAGNNEKAFIAILFIVSAFASAFVNASLTVAILFPIIDAVVMQSNGKISRKGTYMVLGISSVLGNNLLTIGATSMLTAVSILAENGYGEMSLFTPFIVNAPAVLVVFLMYVTVGKKLQDKWFDFEEVPIASGASKQDNNAEHPVWKQALVGIVLVVVIIALIMGVNYGMAALMGASVLMITGCISEKQAFSSISWGTVIVVAGAIGFSKGIQASGAGDVIANFFMQISGPLGQSGIGMCIIIFFVSSLISNVMSDNATVAIVLPIAMSIAHAMGLNPTPLFLAACSGTKVGIATPISVAPMTQIGVAGYRFKDYLKMGGLVNVICMIITCIMIAIVYY
ncbi:anion permease [Sedimentibacter hydroxybenzoicus DSM 7310]|uniref:Anion permease n=1 Tax=Sedimentibacter hydroxybenzoicus DSM 7310 TaxID=1123245 RepID=A0A974BGW9_SEDHY|nr:SLC13 family permease [Sedimentibacter hydroxybenzoicus]NYB72964.1 anion permease [Sedimentibacter hydroxybenzoicus DSM 7310]